MHELGLTRNIIAIVSEHAKGKPVKRVQLAIGPLAGVEQRALEFCFQTIAQGTELEKAQLEFVAGPGDTFLIKEFELEEAA